MFNIPKNGPRQTLSELVSQTSTTDGICPSDPEDPTENESVVGHKENRSSSLAAQLQP